MIETESLSKDYGGRRALESLDLRIREGELYAFLGPNGAGKSTTLRILVGLIRPTSGRARIDGLDVVDETVEVKRRIGYVPDTPHLHERLTALETMRLVGGLHSMERARFERRAHELLERFALSPRRHDLVGDFSLGMRQKLCFAAAFLPEPRAVIIDEPWVGLDPRAVRDVVDFLKERNREGVTVLMSTHSLPIAERIADRVGILSRGRLVAEGSVESLLARRETLGLEDLFLELTREDAAE